MMPLDAFVERVRPPSNCDDDLDFVIRTTCGDGVIQHSWLEGTENDYVLTYQNGAVYGRASGYVGALCDSDGDFGDVRTGEAPTLSYCETCTVCGEHNGSSGAPPACAE